MRINARLEREMALKFRRLLALTKQSQTEVIKRALDAYFNEVSGAIAQSKGAAILKSSGFVGCGAAGRELSRSYKTALTRNLKQKV